MLYVGKRNGNSVPFDKQKIINAINKAFIEVDGQLYEDDTAKDIADEIEDFGLYQDGNYLSVEDIQDMVEDYFLLVSITDICSSYVSPFRPH